MKSFLYTILLAVFSPALFKYNALEFAKGSFAGNTSIAILAPFCNSRGESIPLLNWILFIVIFLLIGFLIGWIIAANKYNKK